MTNAHHWYAGTILTIQQNYLLHLAFISMHPHQLPPKSFLENRHFSLQSIFQGIQYFLLQFTMQISLQKNPPGSSEQIINLQIEKSGSLFFQSLKYHCFSLLLIARVEYMDKLNDVWVFAVSRNILFHVLKPHSHIDFFPLQTFKITGFEYRNQDLQSIKAILFKNKKCSIPMLLYNMCTHKHTHTDSI